MVYRQAVLILLLFMSGCATVNNSFHTEIVVKCVYVDKGGDNQYIKDCTRE